MSKKRVLSNGHSPYWKDDSPKNNSISFKSENDNIICWTGLKGYDLFNKIMQKEFDKYRKI
jgi:hypothetical protein